MHSHRAVHRYTVPLLPFSRIRLAYTPLEATRIRIRAEKELSATATSGKQQVASGGCYDWRPHGRVCHQCPLWAGCLRANSAPTRYLNVAAARSRLQRSTFNANANANANTNTSVTTSLTRHWQECDETNRRSIHPSMNDPDSVHIILTSPRQNKQTALGLRSGVSPTR